MSPSRKESDPTVNVTSDPPAKALVESVLALHPQIATFDCDGTLWSGDAGEGFFSWELEQGFLSDEVVRWARPRYADYKAGKVEEDAMCGELVSMHRGLPVDVVQGAAARYFDQSFLRKIFREMRELIARLHQQGCDIWAVSSSNQWLIRAAMRHFGISDDRVLAAAVEIEDGIVTDRLIRVPSGPDKPQAIRDAIQRTPDVAFGNSIWDVEMLKMAHHPFAVNPTPELAKMARSSGWRTYFPAAPH